MRTPMHTFGHRHGLDDGRQCIRQYIAEHFARLCLLDDHPVTLGRLDSAQIFDRDTG